MENSLEKHKKHLQETNQKERFEKDFPGEKFIMSEEEKPTEEAPAEEAPEEEKPKDE